MGIKILFILSVICFLDSCQNANTGSKNSPSIYANNDTLHKTIINNVAENGKWLFLKVDEKDIVFKNGNRYKTPLYDLSYIGQLGASNKAPFLILSGRSCTDCDENISIYVQSPTDGPMKAEKEIRRYTYPGKEYDYATNKLIFESRMFFGDCFQDSGSGIVWYNHAVIDSTHESNNFFVLKIKNDTLCEDTMSFSKKFLQDLIYNCKELHEVNVTSEP